MRVKEIKKISKKDIVIPDSIMRPFQDEKDEDIERYRQDIGKVRKTENCILCK